MAGKDVFVGLSALQPNVLIAIEKLVTGGKQAINTHVMMHDIRRLSHVNVGL
jgi:hypothetical protein